MHPSGLPARPEEQEPPLAPREPGTPTLPRPRGQAGWRPWTAWAAILTGFGVTVTGAIGVAIVTAAIGGDVDDPPAGVNIGLTLFQDLALIGAAVFFATLAGRPSGADFGLRRPRVWRAARLIVAGLVSFYVFSFIWGTALSLDEKQ